MAATEGLRASSEKRWGILLRLRSGQVSYRAEIDFAAPFLSLRFSRVLHDAESPTHRLTQGMALGPPRPGAFLLSDTDCFVAGSFSQFLLVRNPFSRLFSRKSPRLAAARIGRGGAMPLSSRAVSGNSATNALVCDGCGRLASPEHLKQRTARLERATRFRPVHTQVLFVAESPPLEPGREIYSGSGQGQALLDALGIAASSDGPWSPAPAESPCENSNLDAAARISDEHLLDPRSATLKGGATKTTLPAFSDRPAEAGVTERLAAFQKLGLYPGYLVECPLDAKDLAAGAEEFVSGSVELAQ